jgi:hypothetical protein
MTRRKDKLKQKQENIRKTKNESKSRIFQKQEEIKRENNLILSEKKLLKKVQDLPDELIRIIYSYMSGNAKLFCNFKLDYLKSISVYIYDNLKIIQKLSKKQLLDFIYKGVLQKYPNIIDPITSYCYCLDKEEYIDVYGYKLFNLWENNNLIREYYNNLTSEEEKNSRLDWKIKFDIKYEIYNYITNIIDVYDRTRKIILSRKNQILDENTLFLKLDKVFYLYKCIENLNIVKNKI